MPKKPAPKKRPAKRIGRPSTNPTQVGLTLLPNALQALDAFRKREGLTRPMAARRVIELYFALKD